MAFGSGFQNLVILCLKECWENNKQHLTECAKVCITYAHINFQIEWVAQVVYPDHNRNDADEVLNKGMVHHQP